MRRKRRANPEDEILYVQVIGEQRHIKIEQWKWDVFKKLLLEMERMRREMKADLAAMDEVIARAESMQDLPTNDPARATVMEEVIHLSRVLDGWIALFDDETRERFAERFPERIAESERLNLMILEKSARVIELGREQGLVVDEPSVPLAVV